MVSLSFLGLDAIGAKWGEKNLKKDRGEKIKKRDSDKDSKSESEEEKENPEENNEEEENTSQEPVVEKPMGSESDSDGSVSEIIEAKVKATESG